MPNIFYFSAALLSLNIIMAQWLQIWFFGLAGEMVMLGIAAQPTVCAKRLDN
jgi:hypothetical protein